MEDFEIDPEEAMAAIQQVSANEITRLIGEIAYRDTLIKHLVDKLNEKNKEEKDSAAGDYL